MDRQSRADADSLDTVEATTIDSLKLKGQTIVAKVDVDGHEHAVVTGMAQTLKDNRVLLQVGYFGAAEFLGLRQIHRIGNDVYLGN